MQQNRDNFAALIAFITTLQSLHTDESLAEKGAQPHFDTLKQAVCSDFQVQYHQSGSKRDRAGVEISSTQCLSNVDDVAALLCQLARAETWNLHQALSNRIISSVLSMPTTLMPMFFMLIIIELVRQFSSHPGHVAHYGSLFQDIIQAFRLRYIQPKPSGGDWAARSEVADAMIVENLMPSFWTPRKRSKDFPSAIVVASIFIECLTVPASVMKPIGLRTLRPLS